MVRCETNAEQLRLLSRRGGPFAVAFLVCFLPGETKKEAAANNSTNTPAMQFSEHEIGPEKKAAEDSIDNGPRVIEKGRNQARSFDNQAQKTLNKAKTLVRRVRPRDQSSNSLLPDALKREVQAALAGASIYDNGPYG